jgi:hypothetical protein
MSLVKVYNNDSDPYGLKGHSIFKSVRPFIFGYAIIPKLHEWYLRHHVRAASAKAVSFRRTFGDKAWSQQCRSPSFSGADDRCSSGAVGAPNTVRCTPDSPVPPADHWRGPHVARRLRPTVALLTVGSPDSLVPPVDRWRGPRVTRGLRGRPLRWRPLAHRTFR